MSSVWMNTRIEKKQRDAIDKLVEQGKYASRAEFTRTAVRSLLEQDLTFDQKLKGDSGRNGKTDKL